MKITVLIKNLVDVLREFGDLEVTLVHTQKDSTQLTQDLDLVTPCNQGRQLNLIGVNQSQSKP